MDAAASLAAASAIADLEENTLMVMVAPYAPFNNIILQFVTQRCKKKVLCYRLPESNRTETSMFDLKSLVLTGSFLCISSLGIAAQTLAQTPAPTESPFPPEAFRVLPQPGAEGPEMTPYLLYQTALAWHQDQLREARWSQVKTQDDLFRLRSELRKSVLEMIGGLPTQKTDLHATVTGRIAANGFHIEKLIYQSIPGFYVTALVYVPENGEKVHPAVLVPAGHSENGKIHYQDLCQRLVQRGYLVISWDPVGQGERSQFWDAKAKKSRYNLICAEHAVMGNLAYLAGANLARWEIWDGMRAVDYLLSRPDVDGHRISLTGTSGGGFQTALLGALDERIKVIIPSCYITALPMRVENRIFVDPDSDPEQDLFGFISKGVDHAGLLLMMYPRPIMVATVTLDFFPIQGAHKSYTEVRTFYARFGHADRIGFAESYNTHQYSLKNQEAALNFLDRFNDMPLRHGLPHVTTFSDADLHVTSSGQVSVDYPDGRPLTSLIAEYSAERRPHERKTLAELYQSEQYSDISSWAVGRYTGSSSTHEVGWEALGKNASGTLHIDRYLLHHSTYLAMPLLHIYKDGSRSRGPLIWLNLQGKATEKDWPQIAKLLDEGYEVFSFDLRGQGETRMNYRARSSDDPDLVRGTFDQAYSSPLSSVLADYTYNSILLGRPYFLQMLDDINIAAIFIHSLNTHSHPIHQPLTIFATGDAYTLALRYKEIEPAVTILPATSAPILDWRTLVNRRQEQWPIAFLMPSGATLEIN
ncbi:MAG TPA: acetylxylan esterase [Acidobacteriaceae bacterium]|nr:acetylxylan esterase [Acidobacteriaceae bacterium]